MKNRVRLVRPLYLVQASDPSFGQRAVQLLGKNLGGTASASPAWDITETDSPELRGGTQKAVAFADLLDPARLPDLQRLANGIQARLAEDMAAVEDFGPVRLEAAYLSTGKVVTSHVEDSLQRIYLAEGVYAEVSWQYRAPTWEATADCPVDWRSDAIAQWLPDVRANYLEQLASR